MIFIALALFTLFSNSVYAVSTGTTIYFNIGDQSPNVVLTNPPQDYYNDTSDPVNVTFECNATDDNNLVNISLYITNSTNQSFALNQTTNISGISNSSNWTLELSNGNYTWNCLAYDNASNSDWGDSNRTVLINFSAPGLTNISVIKTDSQDPVNNGSLLNYTINVTNLGPEDAINVTVIEIYDSNVTFNTSDPAPSSGNDTFFLGNLTAGQTKLINITVLVNASAANGTVLVNNVNVTFYNATAGQELATAQENTTVTTQDITGPAIIPISCLPDPANISDSVICIANVTNHTAIDTVLANVTYPTGEIQVQSVSCSGTNTSQQCNFTFTNTTIPGLHNVTWWANDTLGNENTALDNFTVQDVVNPNITAIDCQPDPANISDSVLCIANVTDDVQVDTVIANVSHVNGSTLPQSVSCSGNTTLQQCNFTFTQTTLPGLYNVTWLVNDTSSNTDTDVDNFTVQDVDSLNVTLIRPVPNYYNDTSDPVNVTFECNATDDAALANISLYITNSSNQSFSLNQTTNISGTSNSSSWTLELSNGNYTWNCLAYDTSDNFDWGDNNRSVLINFSALPTPQPNLTITKTDTPDPVQNGSLLNYTLNITNVGTGNATNLTIIETYDANTTFVNSSPLPNATNDTWYFNTLNAGQSIFINITVLVNASTTNGTILTNLVNLTYLNTTNATQYTNDTETTTVGLADTTSPFFISVNASPTVIYLGQNISLRSTASDNVGVDSCWANITQPDSSIVQVNNTCAAQQNFTPSQLGRHNVTFIANDTSGNIATNTDEYFIVVNPINFTITTNQSNGSVGTEMTMYYPPTGEIIHINNTNGTYTAEVPYIIYDLLFQAFSDRLQLTLRNVNISSDNNKTIGMDRLSSPASGQLVTYGTENIGNYTFTNATIVIYYDDTSYTDESNLIFYRCSNWEFNSQTCSGSWEDITSSATQNTANDYFSYFTISFSGFGVGQGAAGPTGAPGGGLAGGGPKIIEPEEEPCEPDWWCGHWGECEDSLRRRYCSDANDCGVSTGAPHTIERCEEEVEIEELPLEEIEAVENVTEVPEEKEEAVPGPIDIGGILCWILFLVSLPLVTLLVQTRYRNIYMTIAAAIVLLIIALLLGPCWGVLAEIIVIITTIVDSRKLKKKERIQKFKKGESFLDHYISKIHERKLSIKPKPYKAPEYTKPEHTRHKEIWKKDSRAKQYLKKAKESIALVIDMILSEPKEKQTRTTKKKKEDIFTTPMKHPYEPKTAVVQDLDSSYNKFKKRMCKGKQITKKLIVKALTPSPGRVPTAKPRPIKAVPKSTPVLDKLKKVYNTKESYNVQESDKELREVSRSISSIDETEESKDPILSRLKNVYKTRK